MRSGYSVSDLFSKRVLLGTVGADVQYCSTIETLCADDVFEILSSHECQPRIEVCQKYVCTLLKSVY
jgi:hypothetical protein